ncbi:MAG: L-aspartate oxidase [Polyangiaceae bacterium]|jgi:L-aspartate oxidase|nr:L-aspartate oxidase [Polyangiaceae bacterium]
MTLQCDYLVIGSGVAGLAFALEASEHGDVILATKRAADESNTRYAQGGIASVLSGDDTFEAHIRDTVQAGAGLCHQLAVEVCVREGPDRIAWLVQQGVHFSKKPSEAPPQPKERETGDFPMRSPESSDIRRQMTVPEPEHHAERDLTPLAQVFSPKTSSGTPVEQLDLGREGGHSARRVAHAGDMTGREVVRALIDALHERPNIHLLDHHAAVDLIMMSRFGGPDACVGAYVLDEGSERVQTVLARATMLCSGGGGKVYLYTSNPDVATGDGVAMAYRAGAEIANMEFYQFHPTCLYHPHAKSFLISEALRGEGAILRLPNGEAFMQSHHPRAELAPRDIVARSIDYEMKRTGSDFVLLDITHRPASLVRDRFPGIHAECKRWGIDICQEPIPVVPAAHYMCGGVTTDLHGRTTIPGLWAVGEVACTGLHGANRLASNSLLEGLVIAHRASHKLSRQIRELRSVPTPNVRGWETGDAVPSDEKVIVSQNWDELRRFMWNYVGIVRSASRLRRAARRIAVLQEEIHEYYWRFLVTSDLIELRNIATVAELIVTSAASRKESRGLHYTLDYPDTDPAWARDTVIKRGVSPHLREEG